MSLCRYGAFAAVRTNGSYVVWSDALARGDELRGELSGYGCAFAALKDSGVAVSRTVQHVCGSSNVTDEIQVPGRLLSLFREWHGV